MGRDVFPLSPVLYCADTTVIPKEAAKLKRPFIFATRQWMLTLPSTLRKQKEATQDNSTDIL